ncbi:hypothetical protein HJFPF1_06252 [Paramyrothecium foliicola]|nr:hypothetical protein HJFPF1_06252 [Paramyrothecium foliicola]
MDTSLQQRVDRGSPEEASSTTSADQEQVKKSRPKYPKLLIVKGKKRHVKCDETKPSCNRCLKWKGACSGYVTEQNTPSPPFVTWEKGAKDQHLTTLESYDIGQIPNQSHLQAQRSRQDDSSALGLEFWEKTVPRLVQDHAAVQLASDAAQMMLYTKTLATYSSKPTNLPSKNDGRAFDCYGQALRALVETEMDSADLRPAILCSLFFIIFEIIHKDIPAMQAHLKSGQRMLDELLRTREKVGFVQQGGVRAELRHALRFLLHQTGNATMIEERHYNQQQASCWADELELFDMLDGI